VSARVRIVNAPGGLEHTKDTVRRMARLATEGSHTYAVRSAATRIVHGVPSKDRRGELQALYRWVRDNVRYRFDPQGLEWVQAPARTLEERAGDCDDLATLLGALAQSLGHKVRYRTVGTTAQRQTHVSVEAWDGAGWVSLDPVLEPAQPTTAPRAELGAFGRAAPGVARLYSAKGKPMGMGDVQLWQPTNLERSTMETPRMVPIYRSRGSFGRPKPVRRTLWINEMDPTDLSGLPAAPMGFGILTAIGSAAAGIGKGIAKRRKKKKAAAAKKKKAKAAKKKAAAGKLTPLPAGAGTGDGSSVRDLAPVLAQATSVAREGLRALQASQSEAIRAIERVATIAARAGAAAPARAARAARAQGPRVLMRPQGRSSAAAPKRATVRRRWDAKAKRWVYQQRKGAGLAGVRPIVTVGAGGAPAMMFTLGAVPADQARARALAPKLAADIASRKYSYSRPLAREFQAAAGLVTDGLYAGRTKGALRYYGVKAPPAALFAPTTEVAYVVDAPDAPPAPAAPTPVVVTPTRTPTQVVVKPAPAPYVAPAPRPTPVVVKPAPAPAPKPASCKAAAKRAIDAVRTFQKNNRGLSPRVPLPAVRAYQTCAALKDRTGLYGTETRARAARDLGVKLASLPVPAPFRKPAPAPMPPAPAPSPYKPKPTPVQPKPGPTPPPYVPPAPDPNWEPVEPEPLPVPPTPNNLEPYEPPPPGPVYPRPTPTERKKDSILPWLLAFYVTRRRAAA
jgi:hypothetical protein